MPRKSKKTTEPDAAETPAPEVEASAASQAGGNAVPAGESDLPVKKRVATKRTKKSAATEPAPVAAALEAKPAAQAEAANAEAAAQAADTFDAAFEANDASEAQAPAAEAEQPHKSKAAKQAKATGKAKSTGKAKARVSEPQPPQDDDADLGPDEDEELEGDWESGSGSEDEDQEHEKQTAALPAPKLERLQKIIAAAGIASRRHAEDLITEGRVQVNGKIVTELGSKADAARDHIRVDGKLLHGAERLRYFALNKPRGYVTTVSDPEGRPTVMEFFAKMGERLYPVGRLDYLSEGLLLMTNDGELANKLTRAASGVEKTYLVKVSGQPDEAMIESLREGVSIDRGRPGEGKVQTSPARIHQVRSGENPWYEVTLIEGRNRELRKMFEEIGHFVEKIRRVGYGPLILDLEPGQMRELDPEELKMLRLAAEGKWKPKRVKTSKLLPREAGRTVDYEAGKRRGGKPSYAAGNRGGEQRPPQDRGRGGERPSFGQNQRRDESRVPARREFDRPRPATGGSRPPAAGFGRRTEVGGQDRGFAPRSEDRRRGPSRGERYGENRGQSGEARGEARQGFGSQDRPRREAGVGQRAGVARSSGPRTGGQGGSQRGGFSRPPAQRGGFSRPQGSRPGGSRPPANRTFGSKPEFGSERPRFDRPRPDARPRSGETPRPPASRPPRPGQLHIEEMDGKTFTPRTERPTGGGRGEQRFGSRPQRPAGGGGFRPDRSGEERRGSRGFPPGGGQRSERPAGRPPQREGGGSRPGGGGFRPDRGGEARRAPSRGFGQGAGQRSGPRQERPAARPPRPEGAAPRTGSRPAFGGRDRGPSGGGPRPGSESRGRGGSGARSSGSRSGNRPKPGGRGSSGGGNSRRPR
jgi:23S rRNA pseudouridine2605 synthase